MNFKNRYLFLFSVLAMVLFVACKEDPEPSFFEPELSVMPAENMHRTGATISGTIHAQNNSVVEKFGIEYSEYENFSVTHEVVANASPSEELFTVHLTDLDAGTAYYYRAFAFSGYSTAYSNPLAFSTPKMSAPVFGVTSVNDVSYTSASLQSSITDSGGEDFIMSAYFYKQVESEDDVDLTFSTEGVQQISCDTTYVVQVKNLESGKMYAARPYGITAAGLGYGDIVYFTTPETQKLLVSTVVLGNELIDEGSMEVSASVLSEGTYPIAEYGFCYSTTNTMPDEDDIVVKVNHVGTEFSGKLKNLQSLTTYYVRAYAKNNQGEIAYSEEAVEFTTSKYKSITVEMIGFERPDVNDSSKVVLCGLYDSYAELREVGFVLNDTTKVVAKTNVLPGNATYHYAFELESGKPYVVSAYILTENSEYYYATKRVNIDAVATQFPKYSMNIQNVEVDNNAAVFTGTLEQVNVHLKDEVSVTYGVCVGQKGSTPTKENCLFHLSDVAVLNAANRAKNWTLPLTEGLSPNTEYSYVAYYIDYYGNIVYTQVAEFTTAKPMYNMNVQIVDIKQTSVVFTGTLEQVNAYFNDEVSVIYGVCVGQKGSTPTKEDCLFHLSDVAVLNTANRAKNWTLPLSSGLSPNTDYSYVAYYTDCYGNIVYTQVAEFTTSKPPMYSMNVQVVDIKHNSAVFTGTLEQVNANFEDEVSVNYGVCIGQKGSTPTKEDCLFHLSDVAVLNAANRAKNWTIPLTDGLSPSTEYSYVAYYTDYYGNIVYMQVAEFTTVKPPKYTMNVQVVDIKHTLVVFTGTLEQVNANFEDEVSVNYGVCIGQKGSTPTKENCLFHLSDVAVLNALNGTKNWTLSLTDGLSSSTVYSYVAYYIDYDGKVVYTQMAEFTTEKLSEILAYTVKGVSFNMKGVEGGTFQMGATPEQKGADDDEKPAHSVTLGDYYIGETEVTQELWTAVMGTNPSYDTDNVQYPVEQVSWDDCQTFISKLNALTGENFHLPTEAQWEYAARGGNKSRGYLYSGSNSIGYVAWYGDNSGMQTHVVKTKSPNELGLYDMTGNVWEWCQDWYGSYSSAPVTNPTGPASGDYRVYRGGGWRYVASCCRVAYRGWYMHHEGDYNVGLRLAL